MAEEYKKVAFLDEVAALTDTAPVDVTKAAAAVGTSGEAARQDHKHDITTAVPGNITEDDTAAEGTGTTLARADHKHGSPADWTPKGHATSHKSGGGDEIDLDELGAPTGDVAFNSKKITGLATPIAAGDGATKGYVDGKATGLDVKASCIVATTEALPACTPAGSGVGKTLTADGVGVLTIDGIATVLNDRILVKNQVTGSDNGIYKVTTEGEVGVAFVLTRAIDFDEDVEVTAAAYTFIEKGTTLADQGWVLTTDDPITVDTTALVFGQFSSAGGTPAHGSTHENGGADEISVAGLDGETAELATHKTAKAANAVLGHVIVETASKIDVDVDGKLTLGAHATDHKNGGGDEILLHELGEPTAKVPFAGKEGGDFCLENLAANPAVPVLGKIYFKTGDLHPYVCTSIA